MKLTKTTVEQLQTIGTRYEVHDESLPGFLIRVGVDGSKSFYLMYRAGKGRTAPKKRLHLGTSPKITVEQARALAKEKAAAVELGDDPAATLQKKKAAPTVKDTLDIFFVEHVTAKLKKGSIRMYRGLLDNNIVPAIGKHKVAEVKYRHIAQLHHSMRETPYQANRCSAVLHKFFEWAEKNGYRERGTNPAHGIEKFKEEKREGFMTETEFAILGDTLTRMENIWNERQKTKTRRTDELVDTITPHMAAAIRLLMFTGARLNEILSLEWKHIDLERGIAHLPDSKTGKKKLQLLSPAVAVLKDLPQLSKYVFPATSASGHMVNLKDAWGDVLKQSGLIGWRLHDLRHAFASMMVNSGASLPIVGKILGHTQASTTQRYAHLEENPARKAAENAATKIAAAMNRKNSGKVIAFPKAEGE